MSDFRPFKLSWVGALVLAGPNLADDGGIDFVRDIRPVLAAKCLSCHGPDEEKREGQLRLDRREDAFADRGGYAPIVPGLPKESEVWLRVSEPIPEDRMPPPESEPLTKEEKDLLLRWIEDGAQWREHWAFLPAVAPPVPELAPVARVRSDIDRFILDRLQREGLSFSKPADRTTLIRRLSLDLLGLPPTLEEVETFLADGSEDAYGAQVERLLASPHFGERWALPWLDAARYADTNGYHRDAARTMWLWRDGLIRALNDNQPYDRFLVEQLAGDLLPGATVAQVIASGFNRNHMLNDEGGAIPEEYQVEYVVDRVRTTSTVFMGLTMACAQCHDHKYDPVTQEDYYRFFAFFNKLPEKGLDGSDGPADPSLTVPRQEDEEEIARIESEIEGVREGMRGPMPEVDVREAGWLRDVRENISARWQTLQAVRATSTGDAVLTPQPQGSILASGPNPDNASYELTFETESSRIHALWLELLRHESLAYEGVARTTHGNFVISEFEVVAESIVDPEKKEAVVFGSAVADYSQKGYEVAKSIDGKRETGWAADGHRLREHRNAIFVPKKPFGFEGGTRLRLVIHQDYGYEHTLGHFRLSASTDAKFTAERESVVMSPWSQLGPLSGEPDELFRRDNGPESRVDLSARYCDGSAGWEVTGELVDGQTHALEGTNSAFYFYRTIETQYARTLSASFGSDDSIVVWLNGERLRANNARREVALDQELLGLSLRPGRNELLCKVVNYGGRGGFAFRILGEGPAILHGELTALIRKNERTAEEAGILREHYRRTTLPDWQVWSGRIADLEGRITEIRDDAPALMVMRDEAGVRETRILKRGRYDQPGRAVTAAGPAFLPPIVARFSNEPDRLDLARWMVDPRHPLVARVAVNRVWYMLFGRGLVDTVEDFGTQGSSPSHSELLDHLAVSFVGNGWDLKRLIRDIVVSTTYRQSSAVTSELLELDPTNLLHARAAKFRLDAEFLRDSALRVSGLLTPTIGGPSVRPYQPEGLWKEVSFNNENRAESDFYVADSGPNLYRRSLYTFWKRALPPPNMQTLDAPSREVCNVRRDRTNTPLQALVLMNDPTFVEAARVLAERTLRVEATDDERLTQAFRRATSRIPRQAELELLRSYLAEQRGTFAGDGERARALLSVGAYPMAADLEASEHAVWTLVCSLILNLDESLTRN